MKQLYVYYDPEIETWGFFTFERDERLRPMYRLLTLLHWWHANDASYRQEYMGPLFRKLGVSVLPVPEENVSGAKGQLRQALNPSA
jgi:hypothetical protein